MTKAQLLRIKTEKARAKKRKKKELNLARMDPWRKHYKESPMHYHRGKKFKIRSYGLCQWSKVIFLWDGKYEFYRLARSMGIKDEKSERKEYFYGRIARRYRGPRSCFIEFYEFLQKYRGRLKEGRFFLAAQRLNLDAETAQYYMRFYQACFCK